MNKSDLETLLGRSLTPRESAGCNKYLEIAKAQLQELLCISLVRESGERTFTARDGYNTLFTGIFIEVSGVTVNGETIDPSKYHLSFFGDRNKGFYNSIVFDDKLYGQTVVVNAQWGFNTLPSDLGMFLAELFALAAKPKKTGSVKSKRVEDFQITYGDKTDMGQLIADNDLVVSKYGMCDIYGTRHGSVCATHRIYDCGNCI